MAAYTITVKHLSGSKQGSLDAFIQLPLRIGRSETCQLQFDPETDLKVSAEHVEIRCDEQGALEIVDLDSTNGVLLNGAKLDGPTPLPNPATLEVGGGGPRLYVTYEEGGGFSLSRKQSTSGTSGRKLAATDASFPVLDKKALEEEEGGGSSGGGLPPAAIAGIAVGVIALAALAWVLLT